MVDRTAALTNGEPVIATPAGSTNTWIGMQIHVLKMKGLAWTFPSAANAKWIIDISTWEVFTREAGQVLSLYDSIKSFKFYLCTL